VINEKVEEMERKDFLLVRARTTIESLRAQMEELKEQDRLNASTSQMQLEETSNEVLRMENEIARLQEELATAKTELEEIRGRYDDLLHGSEELQMKNLDLQRAVQLAEAETNKTQEDASWELQRVQNEARMAADEKLSQEREKWHQDNMHQIRNLESKLREKVSMIDELRAELDARENNMKMLQSQKIDLELAAEKATKRCQALEEDVYNIKQRLCTIRC
jgi:chromosome segregation ATPase